MADPPTLATLSASLWACEQLIAEAESLRARLQSERNERKRLVAERQRLAKNARLEAEDVRWLKVPGPTTLALLLLGRYARRRGQEEREALWADVLLRCADADMQASDRRTALFEARLKGLEGVPGRHKELLAQKSAILRATGISLKGIDSLAQENAILDLEQRDLAEAIRLCVEARKLAVVVRDTNPSGPAAGKVDLVFNGVIGFLATEVKRQNRLDYGGLVWDLRQSLRDLDASPLVHAPELVDAVALPGWNTTLSVADYLGEGDGAAGFLADVGSALEGHFGRQKETLQWLIGRLLTLEDRLAKRQARVDARRLELGALRDQLIRGS